jgi:hypothetical protein
LLVAVGADQRSSLISGAAEEARRSIRRSCVATASAVLNLDTVARIAPRTLRGGDLSAANCAFVHELPRAPLQIPVDEITADRATVISRALTSHEIRPWQTSVPDEGRHTAANEPGIGNSMEKAIDPENTLRAAASRTARAQS